MFNVSMIIIENIFKITAKYFIQYVTPYEFFLNILKSIIRNWMASYCKTVECIYSPKDFSKNMALAKAGLLYSGNGDIVICAFSGSHLYRWFQTMIHLQNTGKLKKLLIHFFISRYQSSINNSIPWIIHEN